MLHLALLVLYSAAQIALGLYIGRRVRGAADFFVAGRRLNAPLLFGTLVAANIGAGSTVAAAGLGYRDGLSAWWWVGSAAMGSVVLGIWVGPAIRRLAAAHDLRTLGDFLEWRYDWRVRLAITVLLWIGTLAILAGQLIALSWVLNAVAGWPKWAGCVAGGLVMIVYFTAGGLISSVWVNLVQLAVLLAGFLIALPLAIDAAGGLDAVKAATPGGAYWSLWRGGGSGWIYLAMLGPAFIVSPGLLQKIYGARDDRTVRLGVLANALVLFAFAFIPPLLGMLSRVLHPGLDNREMALPMLLMHDLPPAVGALGLAALFSAEVSTCDAILFMLATSLSQDLYRRFVRPQATDADVLRAARAAAVAGGALGVGIAVVAPTVSDALTFFYTLLSVSLFVPVIAGLYVGRAGTPEALAAIAAGVALVGAHQLGGFGTLPASLTASMIGLAGGLVAWLAVHYRPRAVT